MKNYGLQVKEIPIIFRGEIDAAENIDPVIDFTDTTASSPIPNSITFESSLDDPEKMYVRINDSDYVLLDNKTPITMGASTAYCYGAIIDMRTLTVDYSLYDFGVLLAPNNVGRIFFKESGEKHIQIWTESPQGGGPANKIFSADLTGNGQINRFYARFACGENGTLHLKPYVILNGNIRVDLCNFAQGGDQYIAGDNETISFDCFVPVETHAVAYVEAENVGEYPSVIDAAMTVQYEDFIESESIVGYEGVNLRRGRR